MIYRTYQDLQLSALGFGAMRLPVMDGDDSRIDEKAAMEMVDYATELIIMTLPGDITMELQSLCWEKP